MRSAKNNTKVILEDINSKFVTILKIVTLMRYDLREIKKCVAYIPEMKADIKTIKLTLEP